MDAFKDDLKFLSQGDENMLEDANEKLGMFEHCSLKLMKLT